MSIFNCIVTREVRMALFREQGRVEADNLPDFMRLVATHGIRYDPECEAKGHDTYTMSNPSEPGQFVICLRCKQIIEGP